MQTRRSFVQRCTMFLGALAVSGSTMLLTACGNVAADILTVFKSILDTLALAGIIPNATIVQAVTAALTDVIAATTAYANAPAADKTSLGLKLALAIEEAQAQLQIFWNSSGLTGTTAVLVQGLLTIILSTLAAILPTLPVPPTQSDAMRASVGLKNRIAYSPKMRDSKQFRHDINQVCKENGYTKVF